MHNENDPSSKNWPFDHHFVFYCYITVWIRFSNSQHAVRARGAYTGKTIVFNSQKCFFVQLSRICFARHVFTRYARLLIPNLSDFEFRNESLLPAYLVNIGFCLSRYSHLQQRTYRICTRDFHSILSYSTAQAYRTRMLLVESQVNCRHAVASVFLSFFRFAYTRELNCEVDAAVNTRRWKKQKMVRVEKGLWLDTWQVYLSFLVTTTTMAPNLVTKREKEMKRAQSTRRGISKIMIVV